MWQRFTERARKVVFFAQEEAQKFGEGYVSTEHLLLGLIRESDSVAVRVLTALGVDPKNVRKEVERQLPMSDLRINQDMSLTPRAKRVIDLAYDEARNLNNNYIGTEHLLLGMVREGDGLAGRVLEKLGVELEATRRAVMELQGDDKPERGASKPPASTGPSSIGLAAQFSQLAGSALEYARWEAEMFDGSKTITVGHVLLGILRLPECTGARLLSRLGVDLGDLHDELDKCRCQRERGFSTRLKYSADVQDILKSAHELCGSQNFTGTEHIVLAILQPQSSSDGSVLEERFGVTADAYAEAIDQFYRDQPGPGQD